MQTLHLTEVSNLNATFEQIILADDILDCEPEFIRHEQETVKTTQLLTAEQAEELLSKNHGIIHKLAGKYSSNRNDHDEIVAVAYMGCIKAINGYDPDKTIPVQQPKKKQVNSDELALQELLIDDKKPKEQKIKFVTFAFRCITNEILFYIRNEHKKCDPMIPMTTLISTDKNGNELELEDIISDEDSNLEEDCAKSDSIARMRYVIDTYLTPEERDIILARFGIGCDPKTQSQIANEVNMSQANISKKEKNILQKIKIIMTSKYGESVGHVL